MKAWQIVSAGGIDALHLGDVAQTAPGHGEIRVRIRASAINYRDLMTVKDPVSRKLPYPRVPNSDGAGDVIAIGPGVTGFKVGDRVASCFFRTWVDGACSPEAMASALGGAIDGVLTEEVNLAADGALHFPEHLTYAEAATLPCAALTAWNALVECVRVKAGDSVLLLGTGGVSIFGLQFANLHGARTIIISSSDAKLERAKALGAAMTINYRTTPNWETAVLDATGGRGVDATVEVGGAGTLPRSIVATRIAGTIPLIGVLAGGQIDPASFMRRSIRMQGIYVGSKRMFQDMNRAIEHAKLKPVIDKRVPFGDAKSAYRAIEAANHFGKIVIDVA